jgi:hypothetical protein
MGSKRAGPSTSLVGHNESMGFAVAPRGHLHIAIRCKVKNGRIAEMEVIADPARLCKLKLTLPGG